METTKKTTFVVPDGLWLAVDTCGPMGSVALARRTDGQLTVFGQSEVEGRAISEKLMTSVAGLLADAGVERVDGIVAVRGPGSFTGVRVGLAAVKGLAEAWAVPVVVISRLEVMAATAGTAAAALDAHRQEVYLRVEGRELLAGAAELAEIRTVRLALCDEAAVALLETVWPGGELVRVAAPTASDALVCCLGPIAAGEFADVAALDGHYLRRSDAEIFGEGGGARRL
jgi:tRNA threonylcarbamoyladenosine biosynthesis protein TsaB